MHLDPARAQQAIGTLGEKLGLDPGRTAAGIARVVDNTMATAARVHIAEAGTDPRRYRMIAFGGAGPVHAYALARLLGIGEVIFPRGAGCASAIGMVVAPLSVEFTQSALMPFDSLAWSVAEGILAALTAAGRAVLREAGVADEAIVTDISADMRHTGQGFEMTVPLGAAILAGRDQAALRAAFDAEYRRRFARSLGALPAEVVSWRVRAVAPALASEVTIAADGAAAAEALIERRLAHFEENGGFVKTPVLARAALQSGDVVEGPALIEEAESTAVIGPDASVEVDEFGNLVMRLRPVRETRSSVQERRNAAVASGSGTPSLPQTTL